MIKAAPQVAVFAGKVNAEAKLADGRWDTPVSLSKGEAVVCEESEIYFASRSAKRFSHATTAAAAPAVAVIPTLAGCQPRSCKTTRICWPIMISSPTPAIPKCSEPCADWSGAERRNPKCDLGRRPFSGKKRLGVHGGRRGRANKSARRISANDLDRLAEQQ